MKRLVKKSLTFKEAEEWDILQHIRMTPEERQEAAATIRKRAYGKDVPDIRKAEPRR